MKANEAVSTCRFVTKARNPHANGSPFRMQTRRQPNRPLLSQHGFADVRRLCLEARWVPYVNEPMVDDGGPSLFKRKSESSEEKPKRPFSRRSLGMTSQR